MLSYHITTDSASDCENKEVSCCGIDALERFDSYTGTVVGYAPRRVRPIAALGELALPQYCTRKRFH